MYVRHISILDHKKLNISKLGWLTLARQAKFLESLSMPGMLLHMVHKNPISQRAKNKSQNLQTMPWIN
jgi:hypothetical protein